MPLRLGIGNIAAPFLTSALDEGEWAALCPCRFIPKEIPLGTHWIGGWLSPLSVCSARYLNEDVQPVTRRYADRATILS
jgi:hypothetical protein